MVHIGINFSAPTTKNRRTKNLDDPDLEELYKAIENKDYQLYIEEGKFRAPVLAGDICFELYEPQSNNGINRGYLVTNDSKEIWRWNGKHYQNDGEDIIRDITQLVIGKQCKDHWKNEVISWVKDNRQLRIDREFFDSNIHLINLENGVYNLRTHEFAEHRPEYYFTHC
mgnify:CR=1 FL=1